MRHFQGLLFMGMGEHSTRLVARLHALLDEAVSLSSGLQQSSQGEPEDWEARAAREADLQDAVRDIGEALLGRKVGFGEKLPYPPPVCRCGDCRP